MKIQMLSKDDDDRTALNRERREQHVSLVDLGSEVRLQPPTLTVPPQASSRSEPISTTAAHISSHQQQALSIMSPEVPASEQQGTKGVERNRTTAPYQQYHRGPNLIPLKLQVCILQSISKSQSPQKTRKMDFYASTLMMYPIQPPFPYPKQPNAPITMPQYYQGTPSIVSSMTANLQPVAWQWSSQRLIPVWPKVAQTNPEIKTARTFSSNAQLRNPVTHSSLEEDNNASTGTPAVARAGSGYNTNEETATNDEDNVNTPEEPRKFTKIKPQALILPEINISLVTRRALNQPSINIPHGGAQVNKVKEKSNRGKEIIKAIKGIEQCSTKERVFMGSFKSNWSSHLAAYLENCEH